MPEDLIVLKRLPTAPKIWKIFAQSLQAILIIDKTRIEQWVRAFGEALEMPEIWPKIKSILEGSENE